MSYGDDPVYRGYVERRNRELGSSTTSADTRAVASGDYQLPNYGYKSDGYQTGNTNLGSDPISAVRTLRNQMRQKMSIYQAANLPVKAHLCQTACDTLSRAEGQLIGLNNKRRNALMTGDNQTADQMKIQMEQVKDDGIRNAYADLVTDSNQMSAYGVDSKWTPDEEGPLPRNRTPQSYPPPSRSQSERRPVTRTRTPERSKTPERARSQDGRRTRARTRRGTSTERFQPNDVPRKPRRVRRPPSPEGTHQPLYVQRNNPQTEFDPDIRRNGRLADVARQKRGEFVQPTTQAEANTILYDDPYKPPNQFGQCPYCDKVDPNFGRKSNLEKHYANDCAMLVKCRYCHKVVQVRELNAHYLDRCVFLEDKMKPCPLCGLAADGQDIADGATHPLCRGRKAPDGARWCPLCAVAVNDNKESWKRHLQLGANGCYHNPRLNGEEAMMERERLYGDGRDPLAPDPNDPKGNNTNNTNTNNTKTTTKTSSKLNGAKLIDADHLIRVLQDAQNSKKTAKAAKLKEVETKAASGS